MSIVKAGDAVLNFGTVDELWGTCKNTTLSQEGKKIELENGQGDTTGLIVTGKKTKVSSDFTPMAGATAPVTDADLVGKRLTVKTEGVAEIEMVVDGAEIKYEKGEVTTWSVNGYYYPNLAADPV